MFGRKSESEKKLDAAKVDLAAARVKLNAIDAKEVEALGNGATFAAWNQDRNAASAEIDRLERWIAALQAGDEAQKRHSAEEAIRKRIADARKTNEVLTARIRTEGPRLSFELKALMRDVAQATIEATALNANLPDGEMPIAIADLVARDTEVFPRVEIKTEELSLWVMRDSGQLVGNQDAVTAIDDANGHFSANNMRFNCAKRRFRRTTFHPPQATDHPGHLFSLVRLPNFDRPGVAFDGAFMIIEQVAALNLDPPKSDKKSRRRTETELVPIGEWPAPVSDVSSEEANNP